MLTPLSIDGLPDCRWKFAFAGSTNIGSAFTEDALNAGVLPCPLNRLLFPVNHDLLLLGVM